MKTLRIALATVLLAACGKDALGPTNIVGTWNLVSVDSKALPVTLFASTATSCGIDVQSGQFDLKDGGTYTGQEFYGTLVNGTIFCSASYGESGTYTVSGGVITLHDGVFIHTLNIGQNALSRTANGHQFTYRK